MPPEFVKHTVLEYRTESIWGIRNFLVTDDETPSVHKIFIASSQSNLQIFRLSDFVPEERN